MRSGQWCTTRWWPVCDQRTTRTCRGEEAARCASSPARTLGPVIGPLVSTDWLRDALDRRGAARRQAAGQPRLRVVDCRFRLGEPGAGEALWRDAHIPGAAFLDVDRELAGAPGERGRHPLPDAAEFEAAARRAGIGVDTL